MPKRGCTLSFTEDSTACPADVFTYFPYRSRVGKVKEDVKEEVKEAYDATKAYTQEQIQAFREQTETRLAKYKKQGS